MDIQNTQKTILDRLDKMELEKEVMAKNQADLAESVETIKEDVSKIGHEVHDRITEEISKMRKLANLIIMGLPETDDGTKLAKDLMQILLPHTHTPTLFDGMKG